MKFVALHDLPANEEITQSYFPLDWEVGERQARCRSVYGFECTCPRCALEDASGSDRRREIPEGMDEGYVSVFLLKYLCVDEACEGTMVPLAGEAMAGVMACNVCGGRGTEEEVLEGLAAGWLLLPGGVVPQRPAQVDAHRGCALCGGGGLFGLADAGQFV